MSTHANNPVVVAVLSPLVHLIGRARAGADGAADERALSAASEGADPGTRRRGAADHRRAFLPRSVIRHPFVDNACSAGTVQTRHAIDVAPVQRHAVDHRMPSVTAAND